jgi:FMN phosphatase YigB (HAD superfamily)
MLDLHTFDVFDTVMTRAVFAPTGIFLLVGRELGRRGLWAEGASAWRDTRVAAESDARRSGGEEVTLEDICNCLARRVGAEIAASGIAIEIELELQNCVGVTEVIQEIEARAQSGAPACYISDMYLPTHVIAECLAKIGAPKLPLFVSSAIGSTKGTGRLYRHVVRELRHTAGRHIHKGDNRFSDFGVPRKMGIAAVHFADSTPTALEARVHADVSVRCPIAATVLAGAMKAERLSPPSRLTKLQLARWTHACELGSLLHIGFVSWVIERVRAAGSDRVFFLARDGYLSWRLYEKARLRDPSLPPSSYLYVSRKSLLAASLGDTLTQEDSRWILARTAGLTVHDWLFRLGLDYDVDLSSSERARWKLTDKEQLLDPDGYGICEDLIQDPDFQAKVLARSRTQRAAVVAYLQQEGFMAADQPCIVDIGWYGRMQRSLVELGRPTARWRKVAGCYVGLVGSQPAEFGELSAWLFDRARGKNVAIATHLELFEVLFSAPHATTFGYAAAGGARVEPVLAEWDPLSGFWEDLALMHTAIEHVYDRTLVNGIQSAVIVDGVADVVVDAVFQWLFMPMHYQAVAFDRLAFGSDQINKAKEHLIYSWNDRQIIGLMLRVTRRASANQWFNGQILMVKGAAARVAVRLYRAAKLLWTRALVRSARLGLARSGTGPR